MSILNFFTRNRTSAPVARERLQVLLAHERALTGGADLAAVLKQEILEVIARHIPIDRDRVLVKLDRGEQVSTLEIDIEMPDEALAAAPKAAAPNSAEPKAPARRRRSA
ncbi:MAG: cell division topological specificity factor MinE [Phenylobacterium sp.]|uniref:cell division topological specificity factor MinE n=1 Tax=Phenylobacterium sp. TaxID=1871053 RepID=UPI001A3019A6|nr:cell division topological specificity factor MinE [Phenylobacterium sp.]MBJ7409192.1 cell division topological specificity factor MinE [Phenylobacterium sp.]